jgi:hypothetical protein
MRQIVDAPGRDRGSRQLSRIDERYVRRGPERGDDGDEDDRARRRRGQDPLRFLTELMFND